MDAAQYESFWDPDRHPDRNVYVGQWHADQKHGKGKITRWRRGKITYSYDGAWQGVYDDDGDGDGDEDEDDGDGDQKKGRSYKHGQKRDRSYKHGHGTSLLWNEKGELTAKYVGSWEMDMKEGEGRYTEYYDGHTSDGDTYDGWWKTDQMHTYDGWGKTGTLRYKNGDTYVGSWRQGKKLKGKYTFAKTGAESAEKAGMGSIPKPLSSEYEIRDINISMKPQLISIHHSITFLYYEVVHFYILNFSEKFHTSLFGILRYLESQFWWKGEGWV
jgi:hypothetical protein